MALLTQPPKMRKNVISIIAAVAALSSLSMYRNPVMDLLDEHDYEQMKSDFDRGPALSAPINGSPYWASYNQWLCFPTQDLEISYVEVESSGGTKKLPTLHVTEGSHFFEFSMESDLTPDYDKVTNHWKSLLQDEEAFCVYAAPLQELDVTNYDTPAETASLWIIDRLKTAKGYWSFETSERSDDDSDYI